MSQNKKEKDITYGLNIILGPLYFFNFFYYKNFGGPEITIRVVGDFFFEGPELLV
jgi:hypothetical protein